MTDVIRITDVTLRDGLQQEALLPLQKKNELFNALYKVGFSRLEVTSFSHPKWMPQFADSDQLSQSLPSQHCHQWMAFTPNAKGLERLLTHPIEWVSVFVGASSTFHQKNVNQSIEDTLLEIGKVAVTVKSKQRKLRIYVSTVFGCPYEGKLEPSRLMNLLEKVVAISPDEIALSDTIGVAVPSQVRAILKSFKSIYPLSKTALHFHNTYGLAIASALAAVELGVRQFDGATGGIGGCPYAKGASGNLSSEDLWYAFFREGMLPKPPTEALKHVIQWLRENGFKVNGQLAQVWERGGDLYGYSQ